MRRLSVDPAPRPMLRTERVARAFKARSAPGFGTVISKLVTCHAARGSSCARVTGEIVRPPIRQTENKNRISFIRARSPEAMTCKIIYRKIATGQWLHLWRLDRKRPGLRRE